MSRARAYDISGKVASRMRAMEGSPTLALADLAKKLEAEGQNVVHFEIGEPDFQTPKHVVEAGKRALDEGYTHYGPSAGSTELREAIAEYARAIKVDADPQTEIIVTPGTKHALFCAIMVTIEPGDQVLLPEPLWPTYSAAVLMAGGTPVPVATREENGFRLTANELESRVRRGTKMLVINNPCNPTGVVLSRRELEELAGFVERHDILVMSDEIYSEIVYDGTGFVPFASIAGMRERTITLNGFSKAYAMTGWRLGYAIAPREIVTEMKKIQQNTTTCPSPFAERAGVAALRGPRESIVDMVREYDSRRRFVLERLRSFQGVSCCVPQGTFYVFPNVSSFGLSSAEMAKYLLGEFQVATVPGSDFGRAAEGFLRISYAASMDMIREGLERMDRAFARPRRE